MSIRAAGPVILPVLLLVVLVLLGAGGLSAQVTLEGELRDEETDEPVSGALVVLVDEAGDVRHGNLTDPEGRFRLRTSQPGVYSVRAERIGYATVVQEGLSLAAGEAATIVLLTRTRVIALDEINVFDDGRCMIRPTSGAPAHALWEVARTALFSAAVLQDQDLIEYDVHIYEREFSVAGGGTRTLKSSDETVRGRPFQTLPAQELVEEGFVRPDGDMAVFHGLDAQALLSDAFQDTHCLSVQAHPDPRSGLVGLAFEPARDLRVSAVQGVLWIDVSSGELRHLEYRYLNVPGHGGSDQAGGRIEFALIEGGGWVVERWWIRNARMGAQRTAGRGGMLIAYHEAGGEVREVRWTER